jgi:hypothetical protein
MAKLADARNDLDLLEAVMRMVPDSSQGLVVANLIQEARMMIGALQREG